MIDKKDFAGMRKELDEFDAKREAVIKKSRDILKSSKHAIYCIHRNDMAKAGQLLDSAKKDIAALKASISRVHEIESIGAFSDAMQEYVEAVCFHGYVKAGKIPGRKASGASTEDYLMGICDFTGELARMSVAAATKKDIKSVKRIKGMVDEIYGELMQFNFRNGELRKKYDSVKWNLKKIEDVFYDLSIRGVK